MREVTLSLTYLEVAIVTPIRSPGVLYEPVRVSEFFPLANNLDGMTPHLGASCVVVDPRMLVHEVRLDDEGCLDGALLELLLEGFHCAQQRLILGFKDCVPVITRRGTRGAAALSETL